MLRLKLFLFFLFSVVMFTISWPQKAAAQSDTTNSISQYGITWTFETNYKYGQFVNGDYWVVPNVLGGSVSVASKTLAPIGSEGSYRHGTMTNPVAGSVQGYDGRGSGYESSSSSTFPRNIQPGQSIVSVESHIGLNCTAIGTPLPGNIDFSGMSL